MGTKREATLWKAVHPVAERLEKEYTLIGVCSVGVLLFDALSDVEKHIWYQSVKAGELPTEASVLAKLHAATAAIRARSQGRSLDAGDQSGKSAG